MATRKSMFRYSITQNTAGRSVERPNTRPRILNQWRLPWKGLLLIADLSVRKRRKNVPFGKSSRRIGIDHFNIGGLGHADVFIAAAIGEFNRQTHIFIVVIGDGGI